MSFIHADGVHDVIITGENGTINGQGGVWWDMWRQRTVQYTRPSLVDLINSKGIIISNVIFKNSPFWKIHPVYSSHIVIRYVTILAPHDSPNTDGVDPGKFSITGLWSMDIKKNGLHLKASLKINSVKSRSYSLVSFRVLLRKV